MGRPGEGPGLDERRALPSRVDADVARVLDLLAERSVRATFFVLGEVARARPRTIARIAAAGHEVACHGFHHVPVDTLTRDEFEGDLARALEAIEDACGVRAAGYRAPIWSLSRAAWGLDTLLDRGFAYDSSYAPVPPLGTASLPAHPMRISRPAGTILELPPLTGCFGPWRFPVGFALGLRLLPARTIQRAIEAENAAGRPAVVAFHPWELDPDPPALRLSPALALAHGFGVERVCAKIGSLLDTVRFGPACELLSGPGLADDQRTRASSVAASLDRPTGAIA